MRVAFVGNAALLDACALAPGSHGVEPRSFPFSATGDLAGVRQRLAAFEPAVVVVVGAEALPDDGLAGLSARSLGILTGPFELARGYDRIVTVDPRAGGEEVWRSLPLPVADRHYARVRSGPVATQALFVGASTEHVEEVLTPAKLEYDLVHVAVGEGEELQHLLRTHDVAVNVHAGPRAAFEHRVCRHLAAGQLLLSEPLSATHGLEPGIDYLEFSGPGGLLRLLDGLRRAPGLWRTVRVRGRHKAESFRASRVWPRVLGDLWRELEVYDR